MDGGNLMAYISGVDRGQMVLFPESLDEYIDEDNPIRVIDAFVNQLDIQKAGFLRYVPAKEGRPGYDPRDIIKLYIYGYFNKIRSSRKLMAECKRNVEVMWLLRKLIPDFRTVADFRKDNPQAIKNVFRAFVRLCDSMGLYNKELVSIDGSKFKAVNSKDRNFTLSKLDDRIKWIDENITEYLSVLESNDKREVDDCSYTKEEIEKKIKELKDRKDLYNSYLNELVTTGEKQKSLTDPESKLMKFNGKFDVGYNIQTAVDSGKHLIADFQVTNNPTDYGLLCEVAEGTRELFGVETIEVVADKGYRKPDDLQECLEKGIIPNVYPLENEESYTFEIDYKATEITDEIINSKKPEDIKSCFKAGIVPAVYKDISLTLEVVEKTEKCKTEEDEQKAIDTIDNIETLLQAGYFVRNHEENTVTCPMGSILRHKCMNRGNDRYENRMACSKCKNKCTKSKYKTIDFKPGQYKVKSKVWVGTEIGKLSTIESSNLSTEDIKPKTKQIIKKKKVVIIKFKPDKGKLKQRKSLSEHPFGTVKRWHDASYLLLKGKEKVTSELSLSFLVYNLKRAINVLGVQQILANI